MTAIQSLINSPKKTIGIIGGMGPAATVDIFNKIVQNTPATKDEDHIRILIDNNPQIPSRVEAIMRGGPSPLPELIKMAQSLEQQGANFLIIPCNTASYYVKDLQKSVDIPILSIINETAKYITKEHREVRFVGILATEMTIRLGLYHKALIEQELEVLSKHDHTKTVEEFSKQFSKHYIKYAGIYKGAKYKSSLQENTRESVNTKQITSNNYNNEVTNLDNAKDQNKDLYIKTSNKTPKEASSIYNIENNTKTSLDNYVTEAIFGMEGIKSGHLDKPEKLLIQAIKELKADGVEAVILGCTELPLAIRTKSVHGVKIFDPTQILAKQAVKYALGIEQL